MLQAIWSPDLTKPISASIMASMGLIQVSSPVPQAMYPMLAIMLLASGLCSTGAFFLYEVSKTRYSRDIRQEAALATVSSALLGSGILFLLLWTGVYV